MTSRTSCSIACTGKTYYVDDLDFTFAGQVTPPPIPWVVTFDDSSKAYTLTDFGNNGSAVVPDPAGGTNKVAQISKAALAAATAGTTVSTGANLSVDTCLGDPDLRLRRPINTFHPRRADKPTTRPSRPNR